jgi:hypothetical protein
MIPEEKRRAVEHMDVAIERAGAVLQSYELAQMEIMATVARAKAIYKRLITKKAELEKLLD